MCTEGFFSELKSFLFECFLLILFLFALYKVLIAEAPKKRKEKKPKSRKSRRPKASANQRS